LLQSVRETLELESFWVALVISVVDSVGRVLWVTLGVSVVNGAGRVLWVALGHIFGLSKMSSR